MTIEEFHERLLLQGPWDRLWPNLKGCLVDWRQSLRRQAKMTLWQLPSTMAEIQRYL